MFISSLLLYKYVCILDKLFIFFAGEMEKLCTVLIKDDTVFEGDEEFRLVLGSPVSDSAGGSVLGHRNSTIVTIKDVNDSKCCIKLAKYFISIFINLFLLLSN